MASELEEYQNWVCLVEKEKGWQRQHITDLALHLGEETGEVARCIRKLTGTREGHPNEVPISNKKLAEELGDVLFVVTRIANRYGIFLHECMNEVSAKLVQRFNTEPLRFYGGEKNTIFYDHRTQEY